MLWCSKPCRSLYKPLLGTSLRPLNLRVSVHESFCQVVECSILWCPRLVLSPSGNVHVSLSESSDISPVSAHLCAVSSLSFSALEYDVAFHWWDRWDQRSVLSIAEKYVLGSTRTSGGLRRVGFSLREQRHRVEPHLAFRLQSLSLIGL